MCAGNAVRGGLAEVTEADWESTWQVKLMGSVRLVRAALPGIRDRGYGRVVLVGGLNGRNPSGDAAVGLAANAGLANFGRPMAKATASHGVTVNVADSDDTETERWERRLQALEQWHSLTRAEAYARAVAHVPMGRPVRPEEVADPVLFLASRRASAITGAIVPVDGGSAEGLY